MDYVSLRAFDETVRAGSIRKASAALGVAPSSVSRSIGILEREMGTALLERKASGVVLTHAGRLVADYARAVLMDYDSLKADLDDMKGMQRRLLRLALVESVAAFGPVGAVTRLRERFGATSFHVRLMPAPQVFEAVREARCDIGLAFCAEPHPDILALASVPEPIVLVAPADSPFVRRPKIELCDLAGAPLALPDFDFGIRRIFDRECAAHGVQIIPALTSNDFGTLRDFVSRGAGLAVLPARAARVGAGTLAVLPFAGAALRNTTIDVIVLRKRRLPRIVKAFADVLIEEIRSAG